MNKKIVILIAVVLAIIAVVAGVFMISDKDKDVIDNTDTVETEQNINSVAAGIINKPSDELADSLSEVIVDKSSEEIQEIIDTELTEEQIEALDNNLAAVLPPAFEEAWVDESDLNVIHYIDENGNEGTAEYVNPAENPLLMTEEELEADNQRLLEEFRQHANGIYNEDTGSDKVSNGTTEIESNAGATNNNPTKTEPDGSPALPDSETNNDSANVGNQIPQVDSSDNKDTESNDDRNADQANTGVLISFDDLVP